MTLDTVKMVAQKYHLQLVSAGYEPIRGNDLNHAAWMCIEIMAMCDNSHVEKAMRWLGFVQGVMWIAGFRSIEDMRKDNVSD